MRHNRRQAVIGRLPRLPIPALRVDTQQQMPPQLHNPLKQPLGIQPPVGTYQHSPILWDCVEAGREVSSTALSACFVGSVFVELSEALSEGIWGVWERDAA